MRRIHLLFIAAAIVGLAASGFAETPDAPVEPGPAEAMAPASAPPADAVPTSDGSAAAAMVEAGDETAPMAATESPIEWPEETAAAANAAEANPSESGQDAIALDPRTLGERATSLGIVLGPQGMDDQGRVGRLHTVSPGDTLWDLAAAYLGNAWVWPAVWIDNDDIDNPHLIMPGDRIWITANEMRIVSDAEAESFLTSTADETEIDPSPAAGDFEAMPEEEVEQPLAAMDDEEETSTPEAFPVMEETAKTSDSGRRITVRRRDTMGFVSADDVEAASSIVDSYVERTFLSAGDSVIVGIGEGDVEVGDEFTIFEAVEEVRDVESNRVLGHHVNILGWLEIRELTGDTAIAEVRTSYSLIERGALVTPRRPIPSSVVTRTTPDALGGKIVFLPDERAMMGDGDYVYLNRGEFHGMEVGSELEVFDRGRVVKDRARRVDVETPSNAVARLVVVSVTEETSVAFVIYAKRELLVGDDVRPMVARLAAR